MRTDCFVRGKQDDGPRAQLWTSEDDHFRWVEHSPEGRRQGCLEKGLNLCESAWKSRGKDEYEMIITCALDGRVVYSAFSRALHGPRLPTVVLRTAFIIVVARRARTMMSTFEDATLYPCSVVWYPLHERVLLLQSWTVVSAKV